MCRRGVSIKADFPPTTVVNVRDGHRYTDFIYNKSRIPIASERAWQLIQAEGVTEEQVEYLPFILKDKNGKVRTEKYGVVNPLLKIACFDFERSKYSRLRSDPQKFAGISRLEVIPSKIPDYAKLFRLAEDPNIIIIRSDLMEKLDAAVMEGLGKIAMGELLM